MADKPNAALMAIGVHGPAPSERYQVADFWCVHFYTYHATLTIGNEILAIKPGCATILSPDAVSIYDFPQRSIHACAHFALPMAKSELDCIEVPLMQDLGARFGRLYQAMEEAIAIFPASRIQAEVRLWDILWQLASPPPSPSDRITVHAHHPAVRKATEIIELRLSEPLSVVAIAAEVDLSHNQLTRLFNTALGVTVIGYIQAAPRRASTSIC